MVMEILIREHTQVCITATRARLFLPRDRLACVYRRHSRYCEASSAKATYIYIIYIFCHIESAAHKRNSFESSDD